MNKNQTAVEWLFRQLWDTPKDKFEWYSILKQAKQMEEEQIITSRVTASLLPSIDESSYRKEAEQYYNEIYGK